MFSPLIITTIIICVASLFFVRHVATPESFYRGYSVSGNVPGLWTLVLSQVTTWIFARSLLNAAILGFYYGFWGVLAYACYYLSFLTGGRIIDSIRFEKGYSNIQGFLFDRFGSLGTVCYNIVITLRLISEVFANLLVIIVLFGVEGSQNYHWALLLFGAFSLFYSFLGGLNGSLQTDRFQMILFLLLLGILLALTAFNPSIDLVHSIASSFDVKAVYDQPGIILIVVALTQVWSYSMHDPVMMDRGFIADRETTQKAFRYAFVLSSICIILFGLFGLIAANAQELGTKPEQILNALMGDNVYMLFQLCLIVSALSTLDSTLSSSAKLVVVDILGDRGERSVALGRIVMILFMVAGIGMIYTENNDLFSAVAVSGTASMFLLPVITFNVLGRDPKIHNMSYLVSFAIAILAAIIYFIETSGAELKASLSYTSIFPGALAEMHKYTKLLVLCVAVAVVGHLAFWFGQQKTVHTNHNAYQ